MCAHGEKRSAKRHPKLPLADKKKALPSLSRQSESLSAALPCPAVARMTAGRGTLPRGAWPARAPARGAAFRGLRGLPCRLLMAARKGGRGPFDGGGTRPCREARRGRKSIGMVLAGERYGFRRQNHTFWRAKGDVLEKACRCGGSRAEGKHSAAPPARDGGRGGAALWPRRRGCGGTTKSGRACSWAGRACCPSSP